MNETIDPFCEAYCERKDEIAWEIQKAKNIEELQYVWMFYMGLLIVLLITIGFVEGGPKICYAIRKKISKRVGKVTQTPIIPFPTKGFENYVSSAMKDIPSNVRIQANDQKFYYYGGYSGRRAVGDLIRMVMKQKSEPFQKYWAKWTSQLANALPRTSQIISIRMDGFEFGEKMHDFIPIGGVSSGSHFTYQMFGDNRIQVTYYVEEGVSYVAGFCIYVKDPTDSYVYWSEDIVEKILKFRKYQMKNLKSKEDNRNIEKSIPSDIAVLKNETEIEQKEEEETENDVVVVVEEQKEENKNVDQIISENNSVNPEAETKSEQQEEEDESEDTIWILDDLSPPTPKSEIKLTVKYCSRLQRNVMTHFNSEKAKHEEWNSIEKKMESEECEECSEGDLLSTYSTLSLV
uniref:WS_DGAT_C domain-containing protein n=1 Tax=Caenorhabditis tropicalis TaxID=1561998 RepID=A0A1I7UYI2_9PELO